MDDFDEFVADNLEQLLKTAYLITWDAGEAEDLVQECLLKVARRWPRVRGMVQPRAYARRILVNLALDDARGRARRRGELDGAPAASEGPARDLLAGLETRAELLDALAGLTPRQRAVLVLRYFNDLTETQTAEVLGCSRGTVKSSASRGLARLREVLAPIPPPNTGALNAMPDQLEQSQREALSQRAAQLDSDSIARLRAIDYHARRRRIRTLPAISALAATGIAAAVAVIVSLGSSAAPAFAGWRPTPTARTAIKPAPPPSACGRDLGSPVLTDSRGPYTATIRADSTTSDVCLSGNGVSMASSSTSAAPVSVGAGKIELDGGGTRDSAGNALTLVDGRTGVGVTAVTIERSDGSSVEATVANGWYLAWWPGTVAATKAEVTSASGTSAVAFPSAPGLTTPNCPSGARCASGYSFGSASGARSSGHSGGVVNTARSNSSR